MKAILFACITIAIIATVGSFVLAGVQIPAEKGFTDTISVRV